MINLGRLLMLAAAALPAWLGSHSKEERTDRMAKHWREEEKEAQNPPQSASSGNGDEAEAADEAAAAGSAGREKTS
ncbi:MAG: hypothetical protein ACFWTZ_08780 [Burkholderia sp.]|jgi:hypothetical protein